MAHVAVQIVTFNSAGTIRACLEALGRQTFSDYQVIVIDNASTDQTGAVVAEMGYTAHVNGVNEGYAAAHNQALAQTDSDYVLTLNPDVFLEPAFLEQIVRELEGDQALGAACGVLGRVERPGEAATVIDSAGVYMQRNRRQRLRCEGAPYPGNKMDVITPIFGPDGAAAVYRRAMLKAIAIEGEIFDADFYMHKEDIDLIWRAALRGWGSVCITAARGVHIRGFRPGQRERVSAQMRLCGVRNRYLLMIKNEVRPHLLRDLPFIIAYDVSVLIYLIFRERDSLGAFGQVWRLRRRMLHKRRMIMTGRRVGWKDIARWFQGKTENCDR